MNSNDKDQWVIFNGLDKMFAFVNSTCCMSFERPHSTSEGGDIPYTLDHQDSSLQPEQMNFGDHNARSSAMSINTTLCYSMWMTIETVSRGHSAWWSRSVSKHAPGERANPSPASRYDKPRHFVSSCHLSSVKSQNTPSTARLHAVALTFVCSPDLIRWRNVICH